METIKGGIKMDIVLKIETIPEKSKMDCKKLGFEKIEDITYSDWQKLFKEGKIPLCFNKIICCSCLLIGDDTPETRTYANEDEAKILSKIAALIKKYKSNIKLITWGGFNFVLPVIAYRCLKFSHPQIFQEDMFNNRYKGIHIDLSNELSKGSPKCSLNDVWNILEVDNIPNSIEEGVEEGSSKDPQQNNEGIDGSDILMLYENKEWETIVNYCSEEVIKITSLYARYRGL